MAPVQNQAASDRHLPQLDAVRCIAVLIVVWSHTAGQGDATIGRVGVGVFGVWLFFVLSGYLITGILLRAADTHGHVGRSRLLFVFYARRFLRIFPAYYLLLVVGALFAVSRSFRSDWPWHVTYTTNWLIARTGRWGGAVGPLWSLGVEEQFYLVWPLLILMVPRARLPHVFASLVALAVASRAFIVGSGFQGGSDTAFLTPTPANLDSLALGALLAWAHAGNISRASTERATRVALATGLCITGYAVLWSLHLVQHGWSVLPVVEALGGALVGVYVVHRTARGVDAATLLGRILSAPSVQYVGRISYAIYLWHVLLRIVLTDRVPLFKLPFFASVVGQFAMFAIVTTLSIGVASLSWFLYERPINSLKDRFRYPDRRGTTSVDEPIIDDVPAVAVTPLPLAT